MKPAVSLITLGVRDFNRSLKFYKDLGWSTEAKDNDPVAFFPLANIILGLFRRQDLAADAGVSAEGSGFRGISLAHNVGSEAEVDRVLKEAEQIGATLIKPAKKTDWGGYSGYFADPDGHLWEVAWNPFWELDADGRAVLKQ